MRVGDLKNRDVKTPAQGNQKAVSNEKKVDFTKTLDAHHERERTTNLNKLLDRITETGNTLVTSKNISDLKRYKNAIADFLKEANHRTYELKEENHWDFLGNRSHHVIVKKIDDKMEELTNEIKNEQEDNLKVLDLVDEIRGLLVDEYL